MSMYRARLQSSTVLIAMGLMFSAPAWAGESGQSSQPLGEVWRIRGEVTADDGAGGKTRALKEGNQIFVGEHIHATTTGEAAIKTQDGGVVAIRPNTEFSAESYAAEGKKTDRMVLRLFTGSLRIISGWIGKLNRAEERVVTPTATIGIRGTDHEPYVLTQDRAANTEYKAGTYDKVNRGKTTLGEGEQLLEIDAGRVGFARQPSFQTKGLMTILMPVLLDKVPGFYVPGAFDSELDQLTKTADADSASLLEQRRKAAATSCDATRIARNWVGRFDNAVTRRDATAILALFAKDASIKANVRTNDGQMSSVDIDRDEMAQSTIAAVKDLQDYRQRRLTLNAKPAEPSAACTRINVTSRVIEQGKQAGKPYRFDSTEEYVLELRDDQWLAIRAETTQH